MIITADALAGLRTIETATVDACITSPPYFGLRDYGVDGQIGTEATPNEFIQNLVDIFREVRRTLKDDGTLWVVIGDSYAGSGKGQTANGGGIQDAKRSKVRDFQLRQAARKFLLLGLQRASQVQEPVHQPPKQVRTGR